MSLLFQKLEPKKALKRTHNHNLKMSTPTVIRVKRRITDDPSDILVLSAKRIRTESGSNYSAETEKSTAGKGQDIRLLKLAGTVSWHGCYFYSIEDK